MTLAAVIFSLVAAVGQQPATPPAPAAPSTPPPAAATVPGAPNETYTYEPAGRRDPFVDLLGVGNSSAPVGKKNAGVAGMVTGEISVRGVMQNGSKLIALVIGPDKKTYIVKAGDKLLDGTIKSVDEQGLVIVQSVNDPLSLDKTREVHKLLRSPEDAK